MTIKEATDILKRYIECENRYESNKCPNITICPACEFYVENNLLDEAITKMLHKYEELHHDHKGSD